MKLRNLLAVSATAFTLLSCNDSDNHPAPGKGELTPITVNIKGNADTRALTGEETGATTKTTSTHWSSLFSTATVLSRSIINRQAWHPTINTHSLSTPAV